MSSSLLNKILSSPTASTPASNRTCNNSNNDDTYDSSSHFQRTVCLYDWWLIKAEKELQGKRLAVAGFTSRELQAMRVFTSAPIVKRYDVFTIETADGICIIIKGFINKSRTIENGFSSEVFSHFVFGFPTYWEAYTEKLSGKEFTTGTGSATCPDLNKSAAVSEFAAVAGMANPSSNTTHSKYKKENDKTKHNFEDINKSSENVSERITNNASKGPDSSNHTAEHNNTDNAKNYTSETLPPLISCVINTDSSSEDNLAVPTEPSSHHVPESSERVANSKGNREGQEGTVKKSKTKEPANLESIIIINAVLGESPVPKDSDNLNQSTLDPAVSSGNLEMQRENGRNKDGWNCGNKNCSTACLPQDSEAIVRCAGEKSGGVESSYLLCSSLGVMHKDYLSTSPGVPNVPEVSGNCVDDTTIFPVLHSAINTNIITPSQVDTTAVNIAQSNSGCRKTRSGLRNLKGKQKEEFGFMGSDKHKSKELISEVSGHLDGENLKRCSSQGTIHYGRKTDTPEATVSQSMSRIIRDLLGNSEGKDKEKLKVICGLKVRRIERNSASVISAQTSNIVQDDTLERMNVFNLCDNELQDPTHNTVIKDNSKQRRDCKKPFATGTPRQNLPGDTYHQSHLKTAVGEKEGNANGVGSSRKKAQRKINFDTYASPLTQERKEKISIVSPESLSLKRSRSGRLLLPSLDFWRNQIAIYDADRKITGIQEAIGDVKHSKGSKSEPWKKQRERT